MECPKHCSYYKHDITAHFVCSTPRKWVIHDKFFAVVSIDMNSKLYYATWIDIIMRTIIIIGALNWGLIGFFDFNLVEWISVRMPFEHFDTIVYCIVGISALFYFFARDYYLNFLGPSAFPCGSLVEKTPDGADTSVTVKVKPNVNVIFWSSEHGKNIMADPWVAYSRYSNAGIIKSDQNGRAILRVRKPSSYKVGFFGKVLPPHVHYRTCDSDGMLSRVETEYIDRSEMKK